jgi:hypothetical protein
VQGEPVEGHEADWPGEAKVSGRAVSTGALDGGPDQPEGLGFRADIDEVVVTSLNPEATRLVVQWWTAEGGLRRIERE